MRRGGVRLIQLLATFAFAAFAAACGGGQGNAMTSPSALPGKLDTHGLPGADRYYTASISPTSVGPGIVQNFSVTITNCLACPDNHVTADNQPIGHAFITVPAGYTNIEHLVVTTSNAGDASWSATLVSNQIQLVAPAGNKRIDKGESVTVTFDATTPCVADLVPLASFVTEAYQDVLVTDNDTIYTIVGSQPKVIVNANCATECTVKGQGYWEHHFGDWPNSVVVGGMDLGAVHYTAAQLLSILELNPVAGNGLIALAHQLVSAKLNIANGEDGSSIVSTIGAADALIGSLVVPPVGTGSLDPSATGALTEALELFNDQCED